MKLGNTEWEVRIKYYADCDDFGWIARPVPATYEIRSLQSFPTERLARDFFKKFALSHNVEDFRYVKK